MQLSIRNIGRAAVETCLLLLRFLTTGYQVQSTKFATPGTFHQICLHGENIPRSHYLDALDVTLVDSTNIPWYLRNIVIIISALALWFLAWNVQISGQFGTKHTLVRVPATRIQLPSQILKKEPSSQPQRPEKTNCKI
ncbi:hypothetical protein V8C37DRAFT_283969 [Trichoderma ceciliae]